MDKQGKSIRNIEEIKITKTSGRRKSIGSFLSRP
jgi:hypothetical protein